MGEGGYAWRGKRQREIGLAALLSVNLRWCIFLCWPSLSLGKDLPVGLLTARRKRTVARRAPSWIERSSVPRL